MRAIRYRSGRVELDPDAPIPTPAPGEAGVRVLRAGIGLRDARVIGAGSSDIILGHEFVGIVEHVASPRNGNAPGSLLGARVVASIEEPCAACELCRSGLGAHCPERRVLGLRARDGCFAESLVLPADNLIPVPDAVDDEHAVFTQAIGAALHTARLVTCAERGLLTVLGDTTLALLTAQVLARSNGLIRLLGREPSRFSLCERWGIRHRHFDDVGRRHDQDSVIVCDPAPEALRLAMSLVRPRGQIVVAACPPEVPSLDSGAIVEKELHVSGARGSAMQEALLALHAGWIDPVPLIARRIRLASAPDLIARAPEEGLKTLIEP